MSIKIKIKKQPDYLVANFYGEANMQEVSQRFEALAVRCRSAKKSKLLIDITAIKTAPTYSDRFRAGERAVIFSEFGIKVAVVGSPALLDPGRLAELVAQNRGVNGRVFTNLAEAKHWLLQKPRT